MHIVSAEEQPPLQEKPKTELKLSKYWWDVSYSYNFYSMKDNTTEVKIIPLKTNSDQTLSSKETEEKFPMSSQWDYSKGDYHYQETGLNSNDYVYSNKIKTLISNNFLYPFLAFALLITFVILSFLTGS